MRKSRCFADFAMKTSFFFGFHSLIQRNKVFMSPQICLCRPTPFRLLLRRAWFGIAYWKRFFLSNVVFRAGRPQVSPQVRKSAIAD